MLRDTRLRGYILEEDISSGEDDIYDGDEQCDGTKERDGCASGDEVKGVCISFSFDSFPITEHTLTGECICYILTFPWLSKHLEQMLTSSITTLFVFTSSTLLELLSMLLFRLLV